MYLNLGFTCPIKRIKEPTKEELITKHNSLPKHQHYHVGLAVPTKEYPSKITYCYSFTPTNESLRLSQAPTTWYKNARVSLW